MSNENSTGHSDLGSVKSENKRGNPWHDARNGEFTTGTSAAHASSPSTTTQKDPPHEKSHAMEFVVAHHKDAAIIAASLNIPTEMILGLSGVETEWGKSRFAVQGNNFFSLEAKKGLPFQKGYMPFSKHGNMATFGSYLDAGRSFALRYGDAVRGITNPVAFAQALVRAKFNSGNSKNGGSDNFVAKTADTINSTKRRLQSVM